MDMKRKLESLNEFFRIPGELEFELRGSQIFAKISGSLSSAEICLHGAHVMSFVPRGGRDLLWLSSKSWFEKEKPIRGGIPVCWPWFGPHSSLKDAPSHGFARISEWNLKSAECLPDGSYALVFSLSPNDFSEKFWNFQFSLELKALISSKLRVELNCRNIGDKSFEFSAALHSYFSVSDISKVQIGGLDGVSYTETAGGASDDLIQNGAISFSAETDRVYRDSEADCVIRDPGFKRAIRVAKSGSRSTVVWNPWIAKSARMPDFGDDEYLGMLCIEAANCGRDIVRLEPGQSHCLATILSAE